MLGILQTIWEWILGLPRDMYGERLDTGWGIVFSTYTTIVAIAFLIGAVRSVWELAKAVDIRFDKDRLEEYNLHRPQGTPPRKIDWLLARKQQIRSLRFTLPFGLIVMATLYLWVREAFTFKSYVLVAVCWIGVLMLIRPWWIWTVLRTQRKLVATREVRAEEAPYHNMGLLWAMQHYLNWGLQRSTQKRRAFIGLLRWANPIAGLFRLQWLRVRLVWPLVVCAFYAALWALTGPVAVFYLNREFDERPHKLKPEWAPGYASEPSYASEAIRDTPGDAGAAAT